MTWLSRIFFSLLLLWPAQAASVSGKVRLSDSTIPTVRKGQDYSGAVVWLEPVPALSAVSPSLRRPPARMEQKDKQFIPHVLAIQSGTDVIFPNFDPIYHNAFSNFSGQVFDLGLYPPGTSRTITFDRAGVVRLFCNIHSTMSALIVVLKYPWFAVTDASGAFTVSNVPPGDYQLRVFHERAAQRTLRALERKITVPAEDLALPLLTISETGYVEEPHKNKYGQDYTPAMDMDHSYPATRK
jgi:plastocyanin